MSTLMRIIQTSQTIGNRPFDVYVFCLSAAQRRRTLEVINALVAADGPTGVYQVVADDAGVLVYYYDTHPSPVNFCRAVAELINRVLGADFEVTHQDGANRGSFFIVPNYGRWPGATSLASLMQNPNFVQPYLR